MSPLTAFVLTLVLLLGAGAPEDDASANNLGWNPTLLHKLHESNHMGSYKPHAKVLTPVLNWTFDLPERQLMRGYVYSGTSSRLRRMVLKLLAGQPVTIAAVGGSITRCALSPRLPCPSICLRQRMLGYR